MIRHSPVISHPAISHPAFSHKVCEPLNNYAVIMAGGSGTRLWPLSRRGAPKQLLRLFGERTLLQMAYERAATVIDPERILVCAGEAYGQVIAEQLPDLPADNLLLEPVGRDSLAAICWSVRTIAERDQQGVVAVLSADHVITPVSAFTAAVAAALGVCRTDETALVTLGVVPDRPHTGYGYLCLGTPVDSAQRIFNVDRFAEKPSQEVAERYLAEGGWWWNSGMFFFRAETFWDQVIRLQPSVASGIEALVAGAAPIGDIYPELKKISVDYAIMEPVSTGPGPAHIVAVGLQASWDDIGSFPAIAKHMASVDGNATEGRVVSLDSGNNLIINRASDGRLIAVCGAENLIVIEDDDVTLVCPFDQAEKVKQLVELAREAGERYV